LKRNQPTTPRDEFESSDEFQAGTALAAVEFERTDIPVQAIERCSNDSSQPVGVIALSIH
jgi:hypothetical protein